SPGTTLDTKPQASASFAFSVSTVNDISAALEAPTTLGNSQAPPSPDTSPSLTKLSANVAVSAAIRISHMQVRSKPAPTAGPFTAAMVGTSSSYKARGT